MGLPGLPEPFNYLYKNPIVNGLADYAKHAAGYVTPPLKKPAAQSAATMCTRCISRQPSSTIVRLAGLCGASAVILGAIGAHRNTGATPEQKKVFETANGYHFIHTIALLCVPMCNRPKLSGSFFTMGMVLFCGSCYYHYFTGEKTFSRLTPWGGTMLIAGWLAMVL